MSLYIITNTVDRKVYVGEGCAPRRLRTHRAALRSNRHRVKEMQLDFNKLGESVFTFQPTDKIDPSESDDIAEWRLINTYPNVYNTSKRDDKTNNHYRNLLISIGLIHPTTLKRHPRFNK